MNLDEIKEILEKELTRLKRKLIKSYSTKHKIEAIKTLIEIIKPTSSDVFVFNVLRNAAVTASPLTYVTLHDSKYLRTLIDCMVLTDQVTSREDAQKIVNDLAANYVAKREERRSIQSGRSREKQPNEKPVDQSMFKSYGAHPVIKLIDIDQLQQEHPYNTETMLEKLDQPTEEILTALYRIAVPYTNMCHQAHLTNLIPSELLDTLIVEEQQQPTDDDYQLIAPYIKPDCKEGFDALWQELTEREPPAPSRESPKPL